MQKSRDLLYIANLSYLLINYPKNQSAFAVTMASKKTQVINGIWIIPNDPPFFLGLIDLRMLWG